MKNNMKHLVGGIETDAAQMLIYIEVLENVNREISLLRYRIDEIEHDSVNFLSQDEVNRLKIIDDLFYYAMEDLKENYTNLVSRIEELFHVMKA